MKTVIGSAGDCSPRDDNDPHFLEVEQTAPATLLKTEEEMLVNRFPVLSVLVTALNFTQ